MVTVKQANGPAVCMLGEKPNCREKVLLSEQSLNHLLSLVSVRTPCKVKGSQGSGTPTSRRTRHSTAALPYRCRGKTAAISAGVILNTTRHFDRTLLSHFRVAPLASLILMSGSVFLQLDADNVRAWRAASASCRPSLTLTASWYRREDTHPTSSKPEGRKSHRFSDVAKVKL